ncbi:MAG TPA: hypothetical protein VF442_03495 [Sphingobium sp.]
MAATIAARDTRGSFASEIIEALAYARNAGLDIDIDVANDIAEAIFPCCDSRLSFGGHHWHPAEAARRIQLFVTTYHACTEISR